MKRIAYFFLAFSLLYGCKSETETDPNAFTIKGEMRGADGITLYLQKYEDSEFVTMDSAKVEGDKFEFAGTLDVPQRIFLAPKDKDSKKSFFLGTGEIQFKAHADSLADARIIGSAIEDEYQAFENSLSVFKDKEQGLISMYWAADSAGDEAGKADAVKLMDGIDEEKKDFVRQYIKEHPSSTVSAYLAYAYLSFQGGHEELDEIISTLDPSLAGSPYVKTMAERSGKLKKVAIGQPAVDFALENPAGEAISLEAFKGKYLLIDFWASWCGPCRRENPNVVAMYEEMKDKGFEILGVSFDTDRAKWLQAIEDDKLTWPHVSDLKGWACEAGQLYAVNSIPHTVLLDKEGTIIAKDLRGEELRAKLEELLN